MSSLLLPALERWSADRVTLLGPAPAPPVLPSAAVAPLVRAEAPAKVFTVSRRVLGSGDRDGSALQVALRHIPVTDVAGLVLVSPHLTGTDLDTIVRPPGGDLDLVVLGLTHANVDVRLQALSLLPADPDHLDGTVRWRLVEAASRCPQLAARVVEDPRLAEELRAAVRSGARTGDPGMSWTPTTTALTVRRSGSTSVSTSSVTSIAGGDGDRVPAPTEALLAMTASVLTRGPRDVRRAARESVARWAGAWPELVPRRLVDAARAVHVAGDGLETALPAPGRLLPAELLTRTFAGRTRDALTGRFAGALVADLAQVCGDSTGAWELAFTLDADGWTGTVQELWTALRTVG